MVSPYSWDVPGGVQQHVRDLTRELIGLGHEVSVLSPGQPASGDRERPPSFVTTTGRAVPVRYNGSVARVAFGPVASLRVRRWLEAGDFDVVHVHEPAAPSLSLLATALTDRPVVATYHAQYERSRALSVALPVLAPTLRKVRVAVAVSAGAASTMRQQSALRPRIVPNGVTLRDFRGPRARDGGGPTLGFVGRGVDRRKGFAVLLDAFGRLAERRPDVRLLVVGPPPRRRVLDRLPARYRARVEVTGPVGHRDKTRALRRMDLLVAPNLGGESFGLVLAEAMAARVPVLASDLPAFRAVLGEGAAGALVPPGDPVALAAEAEALLADPVRRLALVRAAAAAVAAYDWTVLTPRVVAAYERAQIPPTSMAFSAGYSDMKSATTSPLGASQ